MKKGRTKSTADLVKNMNAFLGFFLSLINQNKKMVRRIRAKKLIRKCKLTELSTNGKKIQLIMAELSKNECNFLLAMKFLLERVCF